MRGKFTVIIEEHISGEFDVYADDPDDALKAAEVKYLQGKFVVEPTTPTNRLMMARSNKTNQETEWKEF